MTAIATALGALSEDRRLFDPDEAIYMRVIALFDTGPSLELLRTYEGEPASPAPLFFMVYAWWGKLFGFHGPAFRALSVLITLVTMLCLWGFLRGSPRPDDRVCYPLLVFMFPYIFCMGFAVMAESLTLLFVVIALIYYLQGLAHKSNVALLIGSIAVAAALHVRIHAVFLPAALMVVLLLRRDRSVVSWCLAAAPIVIRVPLALLQGGLTVSRESFAGAKPELGFCPSNINFFFVWFGCLFFPLLWSCRGRHRINLAAMLVMIPFYVWATPNFLGPEHFGAIRSVLLRLGVNATGAPWLLFPFWFLGCYMTVDLVQRLVTAKDIGDVFLIACVIMFVCSLAFSTVAFERYYQLAVPAVVLLGLNRRQRPSGYVAIALCHVFFLILSAARMAQDLV